MIHLIKQIQEDYLLRLRIVKVVAVLAFIAGMLLSWQLWMPGERLFPVLRPFDVIPSVPESVNKILVTLFIGSALIWIFYEKRTVGFICIGSLMMLMLQDQMRWQPWVYLYLLLFCTFLSRSKKNKDDKQVTAVLQLMVAAVYIWSGIHKLNPNFIDVTFVQMTQHAGMGVHKNIGYLLPLIEIATGIALLFPEVRKIAVFTAVLMHLIILAYLSQMLHHNSIVYPWNVAMILFVCLLFGNNKDKPLFSIRKTVTDLLLLVPLLLLGLFPVLNLAGYWDHYLSFSLYSDKPSKFYIAIEESEVYKLDKKYALYFAEIDGLQGGKVIDADKWTLKEMNVPFYPESRFFRKLSAKFCALGIEDKKLVFLEYVPGNGQPHYSSFSCSEL